MNKITLDNTVFISDMDGTLLKDDSELSDFTLETLHALMQKGLKFTVATARSWKSAKPKLRGLPLTLPAATHNGVHIVDTLSGAIIKGHYYSDQQKRAVLDVYHRHGIDCASYSFIDGQERVSISKNADESNPIINHYLVTRKGDPRVRRVEGLSSMLDGDLFYFSSLHEPEILEPLLGDINSIDGLYTSFMPDTYSARYYWLETMANGASKASGVQTIKELTGATYIACFGDNLNDLSMFEVADYPIAVANARQELKNIAGFTALSNEEDGVARFLLSLFA